MKELFLRKNGKVRLWIAAAVLFLGLYWLLFLATMNGAGEIIIEDGQNSFEAAFAHVTAVVPANNNAALKELLDEKPSDICVQIRSAAGEPAAEIFISGADIHTNGYTSTENLQEEGGSFDLIPGERYTLEYTGVCDGTGLENLSFVLYADRQKLLWASGVLLFIAVLLAFAFARGLSGGKSNIHSFLLIYLAIALLFGISSPKMNEETAERTAFANAYAVSSRILGREAEDDEGYVYVEESGIRNMGYLSYSVPLNRFWTDWANGNLRESGKISSLYRTDGRMNALTIPDALMIAAARKAGASYQAVYLSGKVLNALLGFLLFALCLCVLSGRKQELLLFSMFFLSPAMMQGLQSYQSYGLLAAAAFLLEVACLRTCRVSVEYVVIDLLSAGGILCGIIRLVQSGGRLVDSVVCSLLESADRWCLGMAYGFCVNPESLRFPAYLMLVLLLYIGAMFQKRCAGGMRHREKKGVLCIALTVLSLCLSGYPETRDNGLVVLTGITGVCFLPLLLIPVFRQDPERREEPDCETLQAKEDGAFCTDTTVFGWFLFLVLYMGMKCVA